MRAPMIPSIVAAVTLVACSETVGPEFSLQVSVVAKAGDSAGDRAEVGDTVELIGVAHNPTLETILAGRGCSPGIVFMLTAPDGSTENTANGPHLCPFRDNNAIEPGETDFETYRWVAPAPGEYVIRSVVPVTEGPDILSPEVLLEVRLPG